MYSVTVVMIFSGDHFCGTTGLSILLCFKKSDQQFVLRMQYLIRKLYKAYKLSFNAVVSNAHVSFTNSQDQTLGHVMLPFF